MREITCINYLITTHCNRMCPECCCNIPYKKERKHFDWEYIEESAQYFKGIERIFLTGGEPTLHPSFVEIVPKLKNLFQCELLTIETNGWGFKKFPEIFKYFDWIQISHYTPNSYIGSVSNTEDVVFLKKYLKDEVELMIGEITHIPRNNIKSNGRICPRGLSETASYEDRVLYPCCVGNGVTGAEGIILTSTWKEDILNVPLHCKDCHFSV